MGHQGKIREEIRVELSEEEMKARALEPFTYVSGMPGKKIRAKFTTCLNKWFQVKNEELELANEVGTMLHNASLVIDDIQDGSDLRRGNPAAHVKYGVPLSINAGYHGCFLALQKLLQLKSFEWIELVIKTLVEIHEGQGIEIYWRDTLNKGNILTHCPTLKLYENVICKKTSGPFLLGIVGLGKLSPNEEIKGKDFSKFGESLGLYFQMRDDFLNLCSDDYMDLKGYADDITEGKISYIVLVCLNNENVSDAKKLRLWEILEMRTKDVELKKEALEILKETGALDATRKRLFELHTQIFTEAEELGLSENTELEEFFTSNLYIT